MSQKEIDLLFADTLEMNVNFEFVASTAKRMIFPKLNRYKFNVKVPSSTTTSFHHNNQLELIAFPMATWITAERGNMTFSHNPKLREIQLPNLEYFILHDGDLTIAYNAVLQSIVMTNLAVTKFKNLIIRKNPQLQTMVLECTGHPIYPTWPLLPVKDKMIIEENESLKTVSVRGKTPGKVVSIRRRIGDWKESKFKEFGEKSEMRIEGNPKLERATLERLRMAADLSWGRIQDYGECIMEEEIRQLAILDGCLYIYGHLVLAAGARGAVSGRLTRVEGRVYIADLTVDSLGFLLDTEIYGSFESDLCDFDYSRFKSAKKGVRKSCPEEKTTTRRKATTTTRKRTEKPRTTRKKATTTTTKRTEKPTRWTTKRVTTAMSTRRTTTTRSGETTRKATIMTKKLTETPETRTTERATIESTKGGEETTKREEREEETSTVTREETEEKESTETRTQLTPMTGNLTGNEGKGDNKRILIISVVIVVLIFLVAAVLVVFFCRRKSKMKKDKKGKKGEKEESSNGSESSSNSSTRKSQANTSRRNKD